ncbi:Hypothetical protein AA314_03142 [Archangium gephyra]|uniref:Uncharacterized protein n=1 Tax=Archangium gephyra TaxID=48 RepID=A0AAC8TED4_9BACT|nr:Hypothetical protein AA314_03142 [Archangium gephyra]
MARAATHGITVEKDVRGFIELMCALGEGFDADPQLPGVSEVLGKEGPKTPAAKVEQLRELASEHLAQTPTAPADEATRKEASAAMKEPPAGETGVQFSDRTPAGKPVAPCPGKPVRKRIFSFSG